MNVQQAIADFLQHGQAVRNLSDRTLRAYQSDLTQFHSHVDGANTVDITPEQLETYLDKLGTGPYRDTSIRRKVAALKVFFRYLEEKGVVTESPARKLKIKRPVESRVPTVLSNREVKSLLAAPKEQIGALTASRDASPGHAPRGGDDLLERARRRPAHVHRAPRRARARDRGALRRPRRHAPDDLLDRKHLQEARPPRGDQAPHHPARAAPHDGRDAGLVRHGHPRGAGDPRPRVDPVDAGLHEAADPEGSPHRDHDAAGSGAEDSDQEVAIGD